MDLYSDRSWMRQRKSSAQIGATVEFKTRCQVFLDYAYSHPECVNGQNKIRYPCLKCKNVNYMDGDMVNYHLHDSGFMKNYEEYWWAHGQRRDSCIAQLHNLDSSTHRINKMVYDIARLDFDWEQGKEQPLNSDAKTFFKLLDEGSEPLWHGCTKHTILSAVATLLNIKVDYNMSHCKKMEKKLGFGYQKIGACPNDYMLFYKKNEHKTKCTFCDHDRFRLIKEGVTTKKINIPLKILRYFLITHRLRRLYMSLRTTEHMTWHAKSPAKDGELNHPVDGRLEKIST